jgi:hypothetical protein
MKDLFWLTLNAKKLDPNPDPEPDDEPEPDPYDEPDDS